MKRSLLILPLLLLFACARSKEMPLPGDSVSDDGAVTLSPPRLSSSPTPAVTGAEGPIESRLYPPELAMERQAELAITEEQRKALILESERGHSEVLKLQWELEAEKEKLVKLLEPDRVDEARVKEAAARVMDRESKVKAAYLTMLVRVKNILTAEQKAKLRQLRAAPARAVNDGGAPRNADGGHKTP